MAAAGGLGLVAPAERDAEAASTFGVGELISLAVDSGVRQVVVTVGGSATTDGGAGAIAAIDAHGGVRGVELVVVCDVTTPFERAAEVYAPQKGASPEAVARLSARLDALATSFPRDPRGVPMTGAAGGLSGGLWARFDASLVAGAPWVLDAVGFDARLAACSAVVTGEGRLDAQTFEGKLVGEVAARAARAGKPVHAVVGSSDLSPSEAAALGLASVTVASDLPTLQAAGAALAAG
jgi:glycerate kinase